MAKSTLSLEFTIGKIQKNHFHRYIGYHYSPLDICCHIVYATLGLSSDANDLSVS